MTAINRQLNNLDVPPRGPTRRRVARLATEIFAPAPVAAALLVVVAFHGAASTAHALELAVVAVLFAGVIPMLYIVRGVRRNRLTDHHIGVRQQRPIPLAVGIISVLVGLALLVVLHAPRDLRALIAAMAAGLLTSLLVTLAWKISIHSAVIAGAVVILVLVFGPILLVLSPVVALVAWARVELGVHSLAQAVAGIALGTVVSAVVFQLLR